MLAVHPSSGPVGGGTEVRVVARGVASGTSFSCRFGNETVPALLEPTLPPYDALDSAATLVCEAPSALLNLSGVPFPQPNATNTTNATSPITRATRLATDGTNGTNATIEDLPSTWAPSWAPSAYWPPLPLRAFVEVSANGVEYSASAAPLEFRYHEPLPYELPMPLPPLGPSRGGTILRLRGVPTAGASAPRCRFEARDGAENLTVVTASILTEAPGARALLCEAPPMAASGTPVALSLSLNAQQWAPTTARYYSVPPPRVESLLPDLSPSTGGLVLELTGAHLDGGSDYRCRFDAAIVVPASYDAQSGTVLCVSPPGLLGYVRVAVSLNGQQFSEADQPTDGAVLTYYNVHALEDALPR